MWTRDGSWNAGTPSFGSIAFFGSAAVGTIALRESNDPGSVSVGTILINSPNFSAFSAGASAATIDFGTGGVFQNSSGASFFVPDTVSNVISGSLALQTTPGELVYDCSIHGAGSVTVGPGIIHLGGQSTFTGGTRVVGSSAVFVNASSVESSGSITSGPFGMATPTLQGAPYLLCWAATVLHNPIVVEVGAGVATFSTSPLLTDGDLTLFGPVRSVVNGSIGAIFLSSYSSGLGKTILHEVIATDWTPAIVTGGSGAIVLAHDNRSSLTGIGTVLTGITEVHADGALGGTGNAARTMVAPTGALLFATNYTLTEEIRMMAPSGSDISMIGGTGGGTVAFAGMIYLDGDARITSGAGPFTLSGTIDFSSGSLSSTLMKLGYGQVVMANAVLHTGTTGEDRIGFDAMGFPDAAGTVEFAVGSNLSQTFAGYVGAADDSVDRGHVVKSGTGTFAANRIRVETLSIQEGTLKMLQEGTTVFGGGADQHVSRVNTLSIATSGVNPIASLDLSNNELVIDYDGTSPLSGVSTELGRWIAYAYAGGGWNQHGIKSSFANEGTFAIGYGKRRTRWA